MHIGDAIGLLVNDVRKTVRGAASLARHAVARDRFETSLSVFRAESARAVAGIPSVFEAILVQRARRLAWIELIVDVYRRSDPTHPRGHFAYFRRRILAPPEARRSVRITFDWRERATFVLDGVELLPQELWRGPAGGAGDYVVTAVAREPTGAPIERLSVAQRL
jgi:hypothetical protein